MEDKWICQSFWTKPMGPSYIKANLTTAKISLYYAHRSGYRVRMHTDSRGYQYLKDVGYDELLTTLDEIPENIPQKLFAFPKYIVLKKEPLGVIHTDFDVFIKKPCLDKFYQDKSIDAVLQCFEGYSHILNDINYKRGRDFFTLYKGPSTYFTTHIAASNVGIIGFNNPDLKEMYLSKYICGVKSYFPYIDKMKFTPDLFFEQVNIDYIIKKYKFNYWYLLPISDNYFEPQLQKYANKIGYQHIMGGWKYSDDGHQYIEDFCNKAFIYRNLPIIYNWVSDKSQIEHLASTDSRFIDFDAEFLSEHRHISNEQDVIDLFVCFNKTCEKYSGQNKVILTSQPRLLHAFYRDFNNVCVNSKQTLDEQTQHEIEFITNKVNILHFDNDITPYTEQLT